MSRDKEKTKVVFRVYRDGGDVIALFPHIPYDSQGWKCSSYMHVGQHGAADIQHVVRQTRLATPKEYKWLKHTLWMLGYRMFVGKRCTSRDREIRRKEAAVMPWP